MVLASVRAPTHSRSLAIARCRITRTLPAVRAEKGSNIGSRFSLLKEELQHPRLPGRQGREAFLDATALDHLPGRYHCVSELGGQPLLRVFLTLSGPAHRVGHVAARAEHEAVDQLEIFHPAGAQGLDHNHHNSLC